MRKAMVLGLAAVATAAQAQGGDAAAGKAVFARCAICHAVGPGAANRIGPTLNGVVGRKSAAVPGFTYSAAMTAAHLVWTPAELDAYLLAPAKRVPGNKMLFIGLPQARDRADVIAYLSTFDAAGTPKK